ncbi:hypothetical protein HID58_047385 [Brassica napus]|uniref:F-box associated beta-propeller type 3 domain-containing protein n=1 Tax=Brassica napus TaxID=3708 RepID=A0ABQ8AZX4_BRANA|nr:hypothetical protein HID58_047385 [Brassica napus]
MDFTEHYGFSDGGDSHETACEISKEIHVCFKALANAHQLTIFHPPFPYTVPSPRLYMCLWDVNNYLDTEILSSAPQDANTTTTTPSAFLNWVFVLEGGLCFWKKAALTSPDFCPHVPCKMEGLDGDELLERFQNVGLLEYGGKPTLFDQTNLKDKGVVALWSVEDAGSKKWSCKSQVVQPSQLHLVNTITFNVKGTTQNGKVLLIPKDFLFTFHILSYDIQKYDMRKIEIRGMCRRDVYGPE